VVREIVSDMDTQPLERPSGMSGENIIAGIIGGVVGGTAGYKSGFTAGYRKKEQEDQWVIASLQAQLASANSSAEELRKVVKKLQDENENLRKERSVLGQIKGALSH